VTYGVFLYPLWILAAVQVVRPATTRVAAAWFLLVISLGIAACEWRARKMGIIVSSEGVVLMRPLNRSRIKWRTSSVSKRSAMGSGASDACV